MTLVIMAAGMGSRFGGLKQIEPIGPNGEFIIDYSIYDAIKAGFTKVVFIIKEENYKVFKETIGKRIESKIKVEYAFQKIDDIPNKDIIPKDRIKPWGTAHALYSARNYIDEAFGVISADDFYGRESFFLLNESLKRDDEYSIIGYKIGNTITRNGSVKRGVCFVDDNNILEKIVESSVSYEGNKIVGRPLNGDETYEMKGDQPVCMLMYGLRLSVINFLEKDIKDFVLKNKNNLDTCEYYLPDLLNDFCKKENKSIRLIPTTSIWRGVTYKEDKDELVDFIKGEIEKGIYPENLYE